jgi:hypothetical protein
MNQTQESPATMKSITVRKAGSVRLTSAAHPLYGGSCTGKPILV